MKNDDKFDKIAEATLDELGAAGVLKIYALASEIEKLELINTAESKAKIKVLKNDPVLIKQQKITARYFPCPLKQTGIVH